MAKSNTFKGWLGSLGAGVAAGAASIWVHHWLGVALLSVLVLLVHALLDLTKGLRVLTAFAGGLSFAVVLTMNLVSAATASGSGEDPSGIVTAITLVSGGIFVIIGCGAALGGALLGITLRRNK